MQILKARPLATAALIAMGGAVAAYKCPSVIMRVLCLLSLLLCLLSLFIFLLRRKSLWISQRDTLFITLILIFAAFFLTAAQNLYFFHERTQIPQHLTDNEIPCIVEGTVEEGNAGTGYAYYTISLHSIDNLPTRGNAELSCDYQASFRPGDVIRAKVTLQSPETYYDSGSLYFALAEGIRICLISESVGDITLIDHTESKLKTIFSHWRANLSARLLNASGKERGGLATALFLGDRSALDTRITTNFRRTGTSHLLALSGLHVTILMGMLAAITSHLGIPKRGRLILLVVFALIYLALTGFRISAVRATGMLILLYTAQFIGSRSDSFTTLCLVGWGILTFSPFSVLDGGFWMSFSAVFGLVTVYPKCNDWLNSSSVPARFRSFVRAILASFIAVISVSYCNWLFSGQISPIGILMTVVLTPILTFILTLIPIVLLLDILPALSAVPLAVPLSAALELMIDLSEYVSLQRNITFSLRLPYMGIVLAMMTILLLAMLVLPLRRKILLLIPPLLASCGLILCTHCWNQAQYQDQIQLAYTVRSSGSTLTVSDCEGIAVIDTSSGSFSMLRDTERAITAQGATEIEHFILTHHHRAYSYSVERLAKRWIIRTVWVPMPQTEEEYLHLSALHERLSPLGTELRCYRVGEQIDLFENAVFQIADTSYLKRSTQPILTYMVQTPQEILTFSSLAIQESNYYSTFRWIYNQTDIMIFGEHGPKVKQTFDYPSMEFDPKLILIDSSDLLPYLELSPDSKVYRLPIVTDIKCYTFPLQK